MADVDKVRSSVFQIDTDVRSPFDWGDSYVVWVEQKCQPTDGLLVTWHDNGIKVAQGHCALTLCTYEISGSCFFRRRLHLQVNARLSVFCLFPYPSDAPRMSDFVRFTSDGK